MLLHEDEVHPETKNMIIMQITSIPQVAFNYLQAYLPKFKKLKRITCIVRHVYISHQMQ